MASTSEVTFGARIANAEALSTNLKGFVGYVPPTTDTSIVNYDALIASMKTENSSVVKNSFCIIDFFGYNNIKLRRFLINNQFFQF